MSASEVHSGLERAQASRLVNFEKRPIRTALFELLVHGIKYVYPPERGALTRGIPTGYAAPPLLESIRQPVSDPPVWPDANGHVRGYSFSPLYRSVPKVVAHDQQLYEFLTLVDALRDGRAREKALATRELARRFGIKE
ncbi:MAG: hypothetical protein K2Y22_15800 [Candidatus Obscuribacterales bacterium]|nr:hypothetical protein [Candidatus Obscuribacterales bacterium]